MASAWLFSFFLFDRFLFFYGHLKFLRADGVGNMRSLEDLHSRASLKEEEEESEHVKGIWEV